MANLNGTLAQFRGSCTGGLLNYGASAGTGAGSGVTTITNATIAMTFEDTTPAGNVVVRRFDNADGTASALISLQFIITPVGAPNNPWSAPTSAILAGLVLADRVFDFTLSPVVASQRICYAYLTPGGALSGDMLNPFAHAASTAAMHTFYTRN